MELKAFVTQSLIQIVEGVVDASTQVAALGGAVSPSYKVSAASEHVGTSRGDGKPVHAVNFDVALVVNARTHTEGSEQLSVVSVGTRTEGQEHLQSRELTSRLRFVVPLQLPTDSVSQAAADKVAEAERRERERTSDAIRRHNSGSDWMAN